VNEKNIYFGRNFCKVSEQMTMANEKVIITISTPAGRGLTVDTHALSDGAARHLGLHGAAPEATGGALAGEPNQHAAEAGEFLLAPAPQAAEAKSTAKPWEDLSEKPTGLNFQPGAALHAKMNWVCDNVPKMSRLRILREGAMMLCDALIEKHYKG
jgi:hypothetical protein